MFILIYLHKTVLTRLEKNKLLTARDNLKVYLVVNKYLFWKSIIEQEPDSGYT